MRRSVCLTRWGVRQGTTPHNLRMTTTHLLYLHGFGSSLSSHKARLMAAAVASRHPQVTWVCPALNPSPKLAMAEVLDFLDIS
jgi:uncharacterized protein